MPARSLAAIGRRASRRSQKRVWRLGLAAAELVLLGEQVLEHLDRRQARDADLGAPRGLSIAGTAPARRQGRPRSFKAAPARELVYHFNLATAAPADVETVRRVRLAALVAKHLCLFVAGKLETAASARSAAPKAVREGETTGG